MSENSSATSNVDYTPGLRTLKSFTVVDLNLDVRNLRRPAENYKLFCALLCSFVRESELARSYTGAGTRQRALR